MEWSLDLLGIRIELFLGHDTGSSNLAHDGTLVSDGFNHISRTGLTLCSDKGGTLGNTTESLSQIPGSADEWHLEGVLVYVVLLVRGSQYLGFVDIINTNLLEDL